MIPYQDAVTFIERIGLKTKKDWDKYIAGNFKGLKKPDYIPDNPEEFYQNSGWCSWNHFFSANKFRKKSKEKRNSVTKSA